MRSLLAVVFLSLGWPASSLDNGAARTPPMGWSTWNQLRCNFDDQILLEVADAMKSSGMVAAGYRTLNIDDCWPMKQRADDGHLPEDPSKFPTGMRNFSAELRKRDLGLGIYTSHGNVTCKKFPGSYGFEDIDAQTYADWDVEFVKNDWCSNHTGYPAVPDLEAFERMRDALNSTGKPIVYSIHWNYKNTKGPTCDERVSCPLPTVANMWRIGGDIGKTFKSVLKLVDIDAPLAASAGPGRWNDADMLEVGNGMTEDQDRAHFTMWCMLASPLVAGNDVRDMSETTRKVLTNTHAIAVNQDPLGQQAALIDDASGSQEKTQVWARPLMAPVGSWAVALLNRGDTAQKITGNFSDLGAFPTPNDEQYHEPANKPSILVNGSLRYVQFSVRAKNDAHIRLFAGDSYYSFIFGGSGNTQCWICKDTETSKYPGTRVDFAALDPSTYVDLWVSVDVSSGLVASGRGRQVRQNTITKVVDNAVVEPEEYVVRTAWGSTGHWRFSDVSVASEFEVLDLWEDAASLGVHKDSVTASVPATAAAMYKLVPKSASAVLV